MQLLVSFDVEVWCVDWKRVDEEFPSAFKRYVHGTSAAGHFALPKILEILNRHELHGVFFVESLFAARFGVGYLREIVDLIQDAGHEVQLHVHAEWTDEIVPSPVPEVREKRQHLRHFSLQQQSRLIALGIELLQAGGAPRPTAFRAGNTAANADTFRALTANGIFIDSSIDATCPDSVPDLRERADLYQSSYIGRVATYPIGVFTDGLGRRRHAQIGACSSNEMIEAITSAAASGWQQFVLYSHNFEMMKPGANGPDPIVLG